MSALIPHKRKQAGLEEVTSLFVTELGLQPSAPNTSTGVLDIVQSPLIAQKTWSNFIPAPSTSESTFPACQHPVNIS